MNGDEVLARIEARVAARGLSVARSSILGREAVIARRSDFKLRWAATRLHVFVVALAFDTVPTADELTAFLRAACDHAIEHKGGLPRGVSTGVAAIGVAVVPSASPEALGWSRKTRARWAAMSFPVLVATDTGTVSHPKRMILGGIYSGHLKRVTRELVTEALRDRRQIA